MNAADKIVKARTGLILDMPFFGALAIRLTAVENNGQPTMRTDGSRIEYNADFVNSLSLGEVKAVVAHEVLHCACGHHLRRGGRNAKKWDRAADYVVNDTLDKIKMQLPVDALLDPQFHDMAAETIYTRIPDEADDDKADGKASGCGDVEDAKADDGKPLGEAEVEQQVAEWKIAVAQAAQQARNMGAMPAELDRIVKELVAAKVDWRETLRRFIQQSARNDYRWTPPNRRHVHAGLYLPSLRGEELPPVVVAVDTSGSIDQAALSQFGGELNAILEEYDTTAVVMYADTHVHRVETFGRADLPIKLNAVGGGGTDFRPVFEAVEAMTEHQPCCIVYLTDMDGVFPKVEPELPTLWVSTSTIDKAPFGEVVKI